ncbi:hypothetical protein M569_12835, partial [Genlisea aurea]
MFPFGRKGPSGFSSSSTAEEVSSGIDGSGLTAIVTGSSNGIGAETARILALRGVHVIMAVRNVESGESVKESILKQKADAKIDVMELDLSSFQSVRKFASEFNSSGLPLNLLINNAGVMAPPFALSQDNIELQFATNHLVGHFLLTNLVLDTMKRTASHGGKEGRIVILSSEAHRYTYSEGIRFDRINDVSGYGSFLAYGQSKLANILHANELSARLKEEEGVNLTVNSLHPGAINTKLMRHHGFIQGVIDWVGKYFIKDVHQGAATTCYVALHPGVKGISGEYFSNCSISSSSSLGRDVGLAGKLWEFSSQVT